MSALLTSGECRTLCDLLRGMPNSKRDRKLLLNAIRNGGMSKEELGAASSTNCLSEIAAKASNEGYSGLAAKLRKLSGDKVNKCPLQVGVDSDSVYFVKLGDTVTIESIPPKVDSNAVYFQNSSGINRFGFVASSGTYVSGSNPHLELRPEQRFYSDPGMASLAFYHLLRDLPSPVIGVVQRGKAGPFLERFGGETSKTQPARVVKDYICTMHSLTFFPGSGSSLEYEIRPSGAGYNISGPGINSCFDEDGLAECFRAIFSVEKGKNEVVFSFDNLRNFAGSMISGSVVVAYLDSRK